MSSKQMSLNLDKAYAELIATGKPAPSSGETRLATTLGKINKSKSRTQEGATLAQNYDTKFASDFVLARERNFTPVRGKSTKNVDRWRETMIQAITADTRTFAPQAERSGDYNAFNAPSVARWLKKWKGIELTPAREYSVALYVRGPIGTLQKMKSLITDLGEHAPDEADIQTDASGLLRLWWD